MAAKPIRKETETKELLKRMPKRVAASFTDEQLIHLKLLLGSKSRGKHMINLRSTFPLPFFRSRFYFVLLFGRNYRQLSVPEVRFSILSKLVLLVFAILFFLLVAYLVKSWLGINVFEDFSFGIWGWFKKLFQ